MYQMNEETVLELIDETRGNLSAIARECRVFRSSVVAFIERHPKLLEAVRDMRATLVDDARHQLGRCLAQGQKWAVEYALRMTTKPDEFGARIENRQPELTNEERLNLLQELVESVKKEQDAAAGSPESSSVVDSAEKPSPAYISAEGAPLQQIPTNDGCQQYHGETCFTPLRKEARQHGQPAGNPPKQQQTAATYNFLPQNPARTGPPNAGGAHEVEWKINRSVTQIDWVYDFEPSTASVIADVPPVLQQTTTSYHDTLQHSPHARGAPPRLRH